MKKLTLCLIIITILFVSVFFVSVPSKTEQIAYGEQLFQHYVFSQDTTAYVAPQGATTASGEVATIGMVAVHPNTFSPIDYIAVYSGPVIPFGTIITINQSMSALKYVTYPNSSAQYTQFIVEDLGQLNNQQNYSTWWVDLYFGVNNATNTQAAFNFGTKSMSYTFWAPLS